ncbi:hypothetical protein [Larkinella punicea]|uniref:Uncharacterized protein n=1 Tax=Larkinella punicea TaxID=2315727 RepID=A0A368JEK3_9BACT|nr:hypothetical protein [Larkinella punicea]RCR66110.1 hypothetical protein DUE52_28515 [Larkinella punicea]
MERIRRQLIRPKKLLEIEPYKAVILWSNGEIRVNDFSQEVQEWEAGANKYLAKLAVPKVFMTAFIKENALAFSGVKIKVPGIPGTQPLDLDPDVLYKDSKKIGRSVSPEEISTFTNPRRKPEKPAIELTFSKKGKSIQFSFGDSEAPELGRKIRALFIQMGNELIKIEN